MRAIVLSGVCTTVLLHPGGPSRLPAWWTERRARSGVQYSYSHLEPMGGETIAKGTIIALAGHVGLGLRATNTLVRRTNETAM